MNLAEETAPRIAAAWIISPVWVLARLVAAPLVIVPVVSLLTFRSTTPEQLAVLVIALPRWGNMYQPSREPTASGICVVVSSRGFRRLRRLCPRWSNLLGLFVVFHAERLPNDFETPTPSVT